jgi:hypothetical protein
MLIRLAPPLSAALAIALAPLARAQYTTPGLFSGESGPPSISSNGRMVAFASLLPDGDNLWDIFLYNRTSPPPGAIQFVSLRQGGGSDGHCWDPCISDNGRFIVYTSTSRALGPVDNNQRPDVYLFDRVAQTTTRVSVAIGAPQVETNGDSGWPVVAVSADAQTVFVAFQTAATNILLNAPSAQHVVLASIPIASPTQISYTLIGIGLHPAISATGDRIVFEDPLGTIRVWRRNNSPAILTPLQGAGQRPDISSDGRFVAFETQGLVEFWDVDQTTGILGHSPGTDVALSGDGAWASYLLNGRQRLWETGASPLFPDFILDPGSVGVGNPAPVPPGDSSMAASLTQDGRIVAFASASPDLIGGDANGGQDVFLLQDIAGRSMTEATGPWIQLPCPCMNPLTDGRGCPNSASATGMSLLATGTALLANDTVSLTITGGSPGGMVQVMGLTSAPCPGQYGDGLALDLPTLANPNVQLLGTLQLNTNGRGTFPPSGTALSTLGSGAIPLFYAHYADMQGFCVSPTTTQYCDPGLDAAYNQSNTLYVNWQ